MRVSKVSNRSRRRAKGKGVKKMRARVPIEHENAGHIHTYGQCVSEMSGLIRESKGPAQFSFKRPLL